MGSPVLCFLFPFLPFCNISSACPECTMNHLGHVSTIFPPTDLTTIANVTGTFTETPPLTTHNLTIILKSTVSPFSHRTNSSSPLPPKTTSEVFTGPIEENNSTTEIITSSTGNDSNFTSDGPLETTTEIITSSTGNDTNSTSHVLPETTTKIITSSTGNDFNSTSRMLPETTTEIISSTGNDTNSTSQVPPETTTEIITSSTGNDTNSTSDVPLETTIDVTGSTENETTSTVPPETTPAIVTGSTGDATTAVPPTKAPGLSKGAVAGIVIGVLLIKGALAAGIILLLKRRNQNAGARQQGRIVHGCHLCIAHGRPNIGGGQMIFGATMTENWKAKTAF